MENLIENGQHPVGKKCSTDIHLPFWRSAQNIIRIGETTAIVTYDMRH